MRGGVLGVDRGDDDRHVGDLCRVAAITADDADDAGTALLGKLEGTHKVGADVFFEVAAADGENEERVLLVEPAALEPLGEDAFPALVVGARGQLGNVVGRRVAFQPGDLAEIVDRVRCIGRAAADAQDEKPAAALADINTYFISYI